MRWHPSEEIVLSASYDNSIKQWAEEEDDWYATQTMSGHTSTVWSIAFDPTTNGSRFVSASDDLVCIHSHYSFTPAGCEKEAC